MTTTKTVPSTKKTETISANDIYNAAIADAEVSKSVLDACWGFAKALRNNLANGDELFDATVRAARWTINRFKGFDDVTDEEVRDLERLLEAAVQAVKPAEDSRPPVSWETTTGQPTRQTTATRKPRESQPLDIKKAPEPTLKVTVTPLNQTEGEIKALRAEIKEFERTIADGERISDEESRKKLDALKTRLQEATAERERLLAEARAKKDAIKAAAKGKKAQAAPAPAPKQSKAEKAAAKAAATAKHGQQRAA
jgi:hypothetical protein